MESGSTAIQEVHQDDEGQTAILGKISLFKGAGYHVWCNFGFCLGAALVL